MGDGPTDEAQVDREPTDQPVAANEAAPLADTLAAVPPTEDFEHRRIVGSARLKLFGRGPSPTIGRYRVERRIGAGGMGEVYLATDEDLGRRVAIKRVLATSTNERHQQRLRQEARALARLSHPNVVHVYEVGEHEGRTFIAMEYVHGKTLAQWLSDEVRPWRTVLEVFLRAGRGLSAAHAAGLVHRDFKPDNVLMGDDDSVRVADFGLVLAGEPPEPSDSDAASLGGPATPLSVTGPLRGTIRYMPLEQLVGDKLDARSDQFSFCVALYEALWGMPPFSLASSIARIEALRDGDPQSPRPRDGQRVPSALWRVIRRGLSREPEARWPDIDALLAALERVMGRRRRVAWIASAGLASTLLGGGLVMGGSSDADPCANVARELDDAWSDALREQLEARFEALPADHAEGSRERVVAGLDEWSAQWVEQREQVCLATEERRIEAELGRQRNTCLVRQRQQVEDLVDLLAAPSDDGEALVHAVDAVAELPPASACGTELALLGIDPPPAELQDDVEAVRRDIGRARQLRLLGRIAEGQSLAERSSRTAQDLGYGPLLAEALAEHARAEIESGSLPLGLERLEKAIDTAEIHHHDHLSALLWTSLALHTLIDREERETGSWQLRRAETANLRVDPSARMRARLALARGQLAELERDPNRAEIQYREALDRSDQSSAARLDRPSYLSALARVIAERNESEAYALLREAVESANDLYGPSHPHTAKYLYRLAVSLRQSRPNHPDVRPLLSRAARIWTDVHDKPHRDLARAELLLAILALQHKDLPEAEEHARKLVAIQAVEPPEDRTLQGETAHLLATLHGMRGEWEQAIVQLRVALAVWEPEFGSGAQQVSRLRDDLASALLSLGRLDEASEQLDALLPHVQHEALEVSVRIQRGEIALRRGRLDDASNELRVLEGLDDLGSREFSYALLTALVDLRRGVLEPSALTRLRAARRDMAFTSEQVDSWLDDLALDSGERTKLQID